MQIFTIKKDQNTQFDIQAPDSKLILKEGVTIDSSGHGIHDAAINFNNHIVIEGTTNGNGFGKSGIFTESEGTRIDIAKSGHVGGYFGVSTSGDNTRLVNNGRIATDNVAVGMDGEASSFINHGTVVSEFSYAYLGASVNEFTFENTGKITSVNGLLFDADNLTATFGKNSVVKSEHGVIETNTELGEIAHITNRGQLTSTGNGFLDAIYGGGGQEIIRNSGVITGSVNLGGGADRFDGRGGNVVGGGVILGDEGDDTFRLSNGSARAYESTGEGYDRLTVSFSLKLDAGNEMEEIRLAGNHNLRLTGNEKDNQLFGNSGNNRLNGGDGEDELTGGKGNDILTGGGDGDIFHFKPHADREIITDFADGLDHLVFVAGKDIKSIDDLLAHHVHQQGDNLVISGDGTDMIIRNLDKANFDATDFLV